jgi:hypothetical protein
MFTLLKTGLDDHASVSVPGFEVYEREKQIQAEIQEWAWQVHEAALHDASQKGSPVKMGNNETLLKQVSEEVTRQAQEKLKQSVAIAKRSQS